MMGVEVTHHNGVIIRQRQDGGDGGIVLSVARRCRRNIYVDDIERRAVDRSSDPDDFDGLVELRDS